MASEVSLKDTFDAFVEATTLGDVLAAHRKILSHAGLKPCEFNNFFPRFKRAVLSSHQRKNWKANALFAKLDKKANHKCYTNTKTSCNQAQQTNSINDNVSSTSNASQRPFAPNSALKKHNCLVIGSGPAGLRTAIELQLLGASRVLIVEKRSRFSRNNVLHLWPFVIDDLKELGAKKFYGKFCAGSIDHISIRQLQLMLLKVCLMIGCDFREGCTYEGPCPESIDQFSKVFNMIDIDDKNSRCDLYNAPELNNSSSQSNHQYTQCALQSTNSSETPKTADCSSSTENKFVESNYGSEATLSDAKEQKNATYMSSDLRIRRVGNLEGALVHFRTEKSSTIERHLHHCKWHVIIGADGRRNTLSKLFPRKEFRGRLAIAITANFINRQTQAETSVPEISGLSFIYNQDMFKALARDTAIELENICYYKDDTHYFVMTAKKRSLLARGVLINDYAATHDLLARENVDHRALLRYARDAASWTTNLEPLDFASDHYGDEDVQLFDFTSMHAALNACKALRTSTGGLCLFGLVGDSLLEPFWPTGSGCARGFLSAFDAAWMCRQWSVNRCAILDYHPIPAHRNGRTSAETSPLKTTLLPTTYDKMALNVLAERESIYRLLAQTTSENLQQNHSIWTLNPHTRYPNLNRHLVLPSQVEHLISDLQARHIIERGAKVSGNGRVARASNRSKSPKRLKSASSSPNHFSEATNGNSKSISHHDLFHDDTRVEFEQSYGNLVETRAKSQHVYMTGRIDSGEDSDTNDYLKLPLSSTLRPSNNMLAKLSSRRNRDIDDSLRHRRQRAKISYIRDELLDQLRDVKTSDSDNNAALVSELRRIRGLKARTGQVTADDVTGPLSLLNSMRRCASFADRLKCFEGLLAVTNSQVSTTTTTPKIPTDDVRKLPQFATLRQLFVNNNGNRISTQTQQRRSRIPVARLSKEDWNVKCWERRLAGSATKPVTKTQFGSSKSLYKELLPALGNSQRSHTPDGLSNPRQDGVFRERVRDMAAKLTQPKNDTISKLYQRSEQTTNNKPKSSSTCTTQVNGASRSQGWIQHLKSELVKDVESRRAQSNTLSSRPTSSKPIKKLFQDDGDDDDDDSSSSTTKHFDHLCIRRPVNKYLAHNNLYKSHLARPKLESQPNNYNAGDKRSILNDCLPVCAEKRKQILERPDKSSSGYRGHALMSTRSSNLNVECCRCGKFVNAATRITVASSVLHRACLSCSACGVALRPDEVQQSLRKKALGVNDPSQPNFVCANCNQDRPRLHALDTAHTEGRLEGAEILLSQDMLSREQFLASHVNYNELYKNILTRERRTSNESGVSSGSSVFVRPGELEVVSKSLSSKPHVQMRRTSEAPKPVNTLNSSRPFRIDTREENTIAASSHRADRETNSNSSGGGEDDDDDDDSDSRAASRVGSDDDSSSLCDVEQAFAGEESAINSAASSSIEENFATSDDSDSTKSVDNAPFEDDNASCDAPLSTIQARVASESQ